MAYKTFVAGEEALAADVNSYLMSQAVARFASAAARTSGITAPATGQLTTLDTAKGVVDYWNGSAWTALGVAYKRHVSGNVGATITTTPVDQDFTSFTMPFTGDVLLELITTWWGSAPGGSTLASGLVAIAPSASPAPAAPLQFVGPSLPAANYNASFPAMYRWDDVPGGTTVNIKMRYATNAVQLVLASHCGIVTVLPALF